MKDQDKTKKQLVEELAALRQRVAELEQSETEWMQAEGVLRGSEARLRSLFETMAEGVCLIAPDGQIVQANAAAERILALERSEIENRSYVTPQWKTVCPDGTQMPQGEWAAVIAMRVGRVIKDVTMGIKLPDAAIRWVNVSAVPHRQAERRQHPV